MEILSDSKIESILSREGNNKCIECNKNEVEWVSFPSTVFLCLGCSKIHRDFKLKPILKSLLVSDFTHHEINKMYLGGNDRFISLMNEYKIHMKLPNIEYKYHTAISIYYNKLLEVQVNKIEKNPNSDIDFDLIVNQRPTFDEGKKQINNNLTYLEITKNNKEKDLNNKLSQKESNSNNSGWLGFFGDKINGFAKYTGIKGAINKTSKIIGKAMHDYNIKEKVGIVADYAKSTGGYIAETSQKISSSPLVSEAKEKLSQTVTNIKDSSSNILTNISTEMNEYNFYFYNEI